MKVRTLLGVAHLKRDGRSHTRRHVYDTAGKLIGAINECELGSGWYHEGEPWRFHATAARAVEALMRAVQ